MPVPKVHLKRLIAAAALALPAAYGQDKLKGLEMDVMQPGETPAQAAATISLPAQADAAHGARAADAHDNAAAEGQDKVEQARGNNGKAPDHPGRPPVAPPASQRPR